MTKKERVQHILKRNLILLLTGAAYAAFVSCTGIMVPCLVRQLTGFMCPGCGITRMCMALLHGKFAQAFAYNPFLFVAAPFIAYLVIKCDVLYATRNTVRLGRVDTALGWLIVAAAIIYGVTRNLL